MRPHWNLRSQCHFAHCITSMTSGSAVGPEHRIEPGLAGQICPCRIARRLKSGRTLIRASSESMEQEKPTCVIWAEFSAPGDQVGFVRWNLPIAERSMRPAFRKSADSARSEGHRVNGRDEEALRRLRKPAAIGKSKCVQIVLRSPQWTPDRRINVNRPN